jgi:C4-dicarboxylate transporter DctM subunit
MMMTSLILWMFVIFFTLAFLGLPLSFVLGLAATVPMIITGSFDTAVSGSWMMQGINSFPLLACPFFILGGNLMAGGGISKRLVGVASALVGNIPGGLGMVAVIGCVFFGAISGSGPATLAAIGGIMIPVMISSGYAPAFAAALCASSGCIGIFIPPSVAMINYGVLSGQSIAEMFLSGVGPGLLSGLAFCVVSFIVGKRRGYVGTGEGFSIKRFIYSLKEGIWPLLMPIIILGGIYGGVFTPTEAAAVACVYAFVVGMFVTKELTFKMLGDILSQSAVTAAMVMFIIAVATAFGRLLTIGQLPAALVSFIQGAHVGQFGFLMFVTIILIIAGTFMDQIGTVSILTPMLLPIATTLGINPVHFGALMVVNITFGLLTPPLGVHLFMGCGIAKVTLTEILKEMGPFLVACLIVILMVTYIPWFSLFLIK